VVSGVRCELFFFLSRVFPHFNSPSLPNLVVFPPLFLKVRDAFFIGLTSALMFLNLFSLFNLMAALFAPQMQFVLAPLLLYWSLYSKSSPLFFPSLVFFLFETVCKGHPPLPPGQRFPSSPSMRICRPTNFVFLIPSCWCTGSYSILLPIL